MSVTAGTRPIDKTERLRHILQVNADVPEALADYIMKTPGGPHMRITYGLLGIVLGEIG